MSVIRVQKSKNFTVMSNTHLFDKNLSLKAAGLLSKILALPDNWNYSIKGLCAICKESETAVKSALNELRDRRYVIVERIEPSQETGGRIQYEYFVYEHPQGEENKKVDVKEAYKAKQEAEKQPQEKQGVENLGVECLPIENQGDILNTNVSSTDKSNTDVINTKELKTDNKYALEDVKRPSSKGNMYASVPEEHKDAPPKKQSRYIPPDYTEEQLRNHIDLIVRDAVCDYHIEWDIKNDEGKADSFIDILYLFCQKYKLRFGENHYVMPDKTIKSAVRRYLEPPEEMDGAFSLEEYEELIDLYFKTDFNKIGKFKDENGNKKKVVLSFPHFMSDTIRGNLANRLWK